MAPRFFLYAPILWACRSSPKAIVEPAAEGEVGSDVDGDGFLVDEDCDDEEPMINPAATEVCDGLDNNCDGQIDEGTGSVFYLDGDEDGFGDANTTIQACESPTGYVPNANDCDDSNAGVFPGATEICDGLDNDCNETIDDDLGERYYFDGDGDGYGTQEGEAFLCESDPGYSLLSGDCNDNNDVMFPGATEVCDGLDNDCNGITDDGMNTATFYLDADFDGYGDSSSTLEACIVPSGYVGTEGDCDDLDSGVNPGALEVCDGVDNNCDEEIDNDATDASIWYLDYDSDGYGSSTVIFYACEQPENYVDNTDDCNDLEPDVYPGASEVCDTLDNDCNGWTDSNDPNITGEPIWYLDADADGYGTDSYSMPSCNQPAGFADNDADCDDDNPSSTILSEDGDCDGVVTADDCDDNNPASTALSEDADCDGTVTADDCDDANALISNGGTGGVAACAALSCDEILLNGYSFGDGVYWIDPNETGAFEVYCDMSTNDGGWTQVGFENAGDTQTFKYLGIDVGSASGLANRTSSGLIGTQFTGLFTEVLILWDGDYIQFTPSGEVFENTVDLSMSVASFSTNNATLQNWVSNAGGAHFCRASVYNTVRPGDTSWAIKPNNDNYTQCGCNSGSWTGRGAYYAGHPSPTVCSSWPGGWSGIKDNGQAKGGYSLGYASYIFVR